MRRLAAVSIAIFLAAGCSAGKKSADESDASAKGATPSLAQPIAEDGSVGERLATMRAQFARVPMTPDTSFLPEGERAVVNLLIEVGDLMSEIYLRQMAQDNPATRAAIAASASPDKERLLDLFDLHFGPWDSVDDDRAFWGDKEKTPGAGFYPIDMTKEEFERWIAEHPQDEKAFKSPYTVIRREGGKLVAIPYSKEYAEWLKPAAAKLRQAASLTKDGALRDFLNLRAAALLSDDYFTSELAWMDVDGAIEVAIGPYETYTDALFGYKTAFEAFVTVKNPAESAAVSKYKNFLRDMEANLPVAEKYKNFNRAFISPIVVAEQVHGGGDNVPGVQTVAFNLPNDEKVREAKGAKKVILSNVLDAKFERILSPMAHNVLVEDQAAMLQKKYMALETLFHELSHSMGPGAIVKHGQATTVSEELKELANLLEEGKADVMGAYNILYLMRRGELPEAEKDALLSTYFVGLFRAMRFGIGEAHGKGAAYQYTYFRRAGAVAWNATERRFEIDFPKLEKAIAALVRDVVVIQGDGDYAGAKRFLEATAVLDEEASDVIATLADLPVDIQPAYPKKI
ncbi:MAG: hypothetical protein K2Q06_08155 [Parvularculaceae bacterium]|nr:hypothetical protein [Parvularculaceae bacterium]